MATSSIFANVTINNNAYCERLVCALEQSKKDKKRDYTFSKPVKVLSENEIKEFFGVAGNKQ